MKSAVQKLFGRFSHKPLPVCLISESSNEAITEQFTRSYNELQDVLKETSSLAANISSKLDKTDIVQQKLTTILKTLSDGIVIVNDLGIIQEWNQGAENIFKFSKSDALGASINKISPSLFTEFSVNKALSEAEEIQSIKTITTNDNGGNSITLQIKITTVYDETMTTGLYVAVVRDITKEALLRREQEKKQQLINTIIATISDYVIVKDPSGKWILLNNAAKKAFGFKDDAEWLNLTNSEISEKHPHLTKLIDSSEHADNETWASHKSIRTEEMFTVQDKPYYLDIIRTPILDDYDYKNALVLVGRDITADKENKQYTSLAYRALNASSDLVCITDVKGMILFANNKMVHTYKFVDQNDMIGRKMSIVKSHKTDPAIHAELWKTVSEGKVYQREMINQSSDGKDVHVHTTIMPIIDGDLSTAYFICVQRLIE